jgi:hypothetical protein
VVYVQGNNNKLATLYKCIPTAEKKGNDKTVCKLRIVEVGSEAHRGYFEYALTNEIVVDCSLNRDKGRLESPRKKER